MVSICRLNKLWRCIQHGSCQVKVANIFTKIIETWGENMCIYCTWIEMSLVKSISIRRNLVDFLSAENLLGNWRQMADDTFCLVHAVMKQWWDLTMIWAIHWPVFLLPKNRSMDLSSFVPMCNMQARFTDLYMWHKGENMCIYCTWIEKDLVSSISVTRNLPDLPLSRTLIRELPLDGGSLHLFVLCCDHTMMWSANMN